MDMLTWINSLSEAKVLAKLAEQKLHTFTQTTGKAPFDIVLLYKQKLFRISVKGTWIKKNSNHAYTIQLKRVRHNKKVNIIYPFDSNECDILAVYICDIDKVCFMPAKLVGKNAINIRETNSNFSQTNWIVSEWEDVNKSLQYLEDSPNGGAVVLKTTDESHRGSTPLSSA